MKVAREELLRVREVGVVLLLGMVAVPLLEKVGEEVKVLGKSLKGLLVLALLLQKSQSVLMWVMR